MLVYADMSQLPAAEDTHVPNIVVLGGFAVRRSRHDELLEAVRNAKERYTGDRFVPIKWNVRDFRDEIAGRDGDEFYHEVAHASREIRGEMLEALRVADGTCFTSVLRAHSEREEVLRDVSGNLPRWSFVNWLQRLGLFVRYRLDERPDAQLVLDWPPGNERGPWDEEYAAGWARGDSSSEAHEHPYHSGPLRYRGFRPGPLYGNTRLNEGLQVADLVVGATRQFVEFAHLDDRDPDGWGLRQFRALLPHFYDRVDGPIVSRGIVVSPGGDELADELRRGIEELRDA